jgi:hypothetical protein
MPTVQCGCTLTRGVVSCNDKCETERENLLWSAFAPPTVIVTAALIRECARFGQMEGLSPG